MLWRVVVVEDRTPCAAVFLTYIFEPITYRLGEVLWESGVLLIAHRTKDAAGIALKPILRAYIVSE